MHALVSSASLAPTSHVEAWLEAVADTENQGCAYPSNKRRRSSSAHSTAPRKAPRQRPPLGTMSINEQRTRRSPRKTLAPRSRRAAEDEEEETPRPSGRKDSARRTLDFPPPPIFPPLTGAAPASPTRSESSIKSSSTASASHRTRASSPVKNPSDLLFAQWPVDFDPPADFALPADANILDTQLRAVNDGENIVSHAIEPTVSAALERNQQIKSWNLDTSCHRPLPHLQRELDELIDISKSTSHMKNETFSEAAWNDEVHSRLFREALRPFPALRYFNVTSARPCAEYLPIHQSSGLSMESKLVDYTINIETEQPTKQRLINLLNTLARPSEQSMTQTLYSPTRLRPTAISIETKSDQGTASEAKMQLGIWVIAHFAKLRSLLQAQYGFNAAHKIKIPAHPLVIVNTNVLCIMYAVEEDVNQEEEGASQGMAQEQGRKIWVVRGPEIPVPSTVLAGYKCLKALRCLAEWANGSFRTWVEEVLVPPV